MEKRKNETIELLMKRKSMRVFEDKPVPQDVKRQLLEASLRAATAGNMTLYTIIDVTDQALKDKLAVTCDNQPFIAAAPLVLIYCADYRRWYEAFCRVETEVRRPSYGDFMLAAEDAIIAAQTAVTAADAMGLGTCYIGDILENYETHRLLLGAAGLCGTDCHDRGRLSFTAAGGAQADPSFCGGRYRPRKRL